MAAYRHWLAKFKRLGVSEPETSVCFLWKYGALKVRPENRASVFNELCEKRAKHFPIQYILGEWDFHKINLKMRPPVLIPRPETASLVDAILEGTPPMESIDFLEVGVGTGAISLSILKQWAHSKSTAIDISNIAVDLALENAIHVGVESRFDAYQFCVRNYHPPHLFDFLVSNPPYVLSSEMSGLEKQVVDYEDARALDGGETGLDIVHIILSRLREFVKPGGFLWLELHHNHISTEFWKDHSHVRLIRSFSDCRGVERFCQLQLI